MECTRHLRAGNNPLTLKRSRRRNWASAATGWTAPAPQCHILLDGGDRLSGAIRFVQDNGTIAFITRNFADLENEGLEIDLSWAPNEMFNMYATAGFRMPNKFPAKRFSNNRLTAVRDLAGAGKAS